VPGLLCSFLKLRNLRNGKCFKKKNMVLVGKVGRSPKIVKQNCNFFILKERFEVYVLNGNSENYGKQRIA